MGKRTQAIARISAILLGRTAAAGWLGAAVQLALIVLSYPLITVLGPEILLWMIGPVSVDGRAVTAARLPVDWATLFDVSPFVFAVGLNGALAYIPFRLVARRDRVPVQAFVAHWWRLCLWALLLVPPAEVILRVVGRLPSVSLSGLPAAAFVLCTLAGPAWLARGGRKKARWRPVCPECGYSVRRLTAPRCPECGEGFPSTAPFCRRWAYHRLVWDRRERGSRAIAYLKTVVALTVCPCRAARGLSLPDRIPRAICWAAGHLLLLGLVAGAAFAALRVAANLRIAWNWFGTTWPYGTPSEARIALWSAQTLVAWVIAGATWPLTGILIAIAMPGRHPAARWAGAKWSLYATAFPTLLIALILILRTGLTAYVSLVPGVRSQLSSKFLEVLALTPPPAIIGTLLYGLWWARGIAAHPYLRRRGFGVFAVHTVLFAVVWFVLFKRLLNPGGLEWLL
jgi:hypothetical protein